MLGRYPLLMRGFWVVSIPSRSIARHPGQLLLALPNLPAPVILVRLAPLLYPIQPAPRIVPNSHVPRVLRQLRRRAAPHAGLAVEHQLRRVGPVREGLLEAEEILELLGRKVECVGVGYYGDVDGGRYGSG